MYDRIELEKQVLVQVILVGSDTLKGGILDDAFNDIYNQSNSSDYTIKEIEIEDRQVLLSIHRTISHLEKFKNENIAIVYCYLDTEKESFKNIERTRKEYKNRFPSAVEAILFINSENEESGLGENDVKKFGNLIRQMGIPLYTVRIESESLTKYLQKLDASFKDILKKVAKKKGYYQQNKGYAQQNKGYAQQNKGNTQYNVLNDQMFGRDATCGCCFIY